MLAGMGAIASLHAVADVTAQMAHELPLRARATYAAPLTQGAGLAALPLPLRAGLELQANAAAGCVRRVVFRANFTESDGGAGRLIAKAGARIAKTARSPAIFVGVAARSAAGFAAIALKAPRAVIARTSVLVAPPKWRLRKVAARQIGPLEALDRTGRQTQSAPPHAHAPPGAGLPEERRFVEIRAHGVCIEGSAVLIDVTIDRAEAAWRSTAAGVVVSIGAQATEGSAVSVSIACLAEHASFGVRASISRGEGARVALGALTTCEKRKQKWNERK